MQTPFADLVQANAFTTRPSLTDAQKEALTKKGTNNTFLSLSPPTTTK